MSESQKVPTCAAAHEWIEAYVDGELAPEEAGAFERHAAGCADCARERRLAAAIRDELHRLPELDAPAHVLRAIYRRTRTGAAAGPTPPTRLRHRDGDAGRRPSDRAGRARSVARWPLWAALAAALLAVAAGVTLWHRPGAAPEPDATEIARAEREARFALALVGRLSREAGDDVRDRLVRRLLVEPAAAGFARSPAAARTPGGLPARGDDRLPEIPERG